MRSRAGSRRRRRREDPAEVQKSAQRMLSLHGRQAGVEADCEPGPAVRTETDKAALGAIS